MSVYLDSLRIAGIMGIPSELALDLTAPLTLIYAPNGTGKTSMWAAAKALMTVGIDAKIVCQAAGARPAKIVGELVIDGTHYTAATTPGNLKLESETYGRLTGTAALTRLAPEVDTSGIQRRGGVLKDRLVGQIEGCRFLPSESLLYLIDSGEESTELRRKLFADLTGTSALQAETRETKQYLAKLSEELGSVNGALRTIEEQMQEFKVVDNPKASDTLHLIAQAASVAGIKLPADVSMRETLSLLREAQTFRSASLETSQAAYTTWRSTESTYPTLDRDLAAATVALNDANVARDRAQQALSRAQSELDSERAKGVRQQYERLDQGLAKVLSLVAVEGHTKQLTDSSLGSLRQLLRHFDSQRAIESRLAALQQLDGSRHNYRDQISERQDLLEKHKTLLSNLQTPSSDLQAMLNGKTVERSELVARISRQSDLAASLRASAQSLVATSQLSTCPCCSHRWQSVDALLAAIAEGNLSAHTDPQLIREQEAVEDAIGQLQVKYAAASATEEQVRKLEVRLNELNASIERTERLALANEVMLPRLLDVADTLEEVYTLRSYLCLWRILEALDDLGDSLDETQTVEATLSALSVRCEALKAATARSKQAEANRKLLIEREQVALRSSSETANRCEEQTVKLNRIRHERDEAIEQLRSAGLFAGPQTAATLNEGRITLEKLTNLITQVSAAVEASAAIATRERIAANQKALQTRRDRILLEVRRAERLVDLLTKVEKSAGHQFFDKLGPAVGTLFDHMQVNRVFKSLEISAVRESFRIDGQIDDEVSLDPATHFSQGQRQDLALSMFLVRAASLGGSFFLDEPLAHLDDLNRTALLDCLRACVIGTASSPRPVRLVVTTANWSVARHLMQKFYSVRRPSADPLLRVIQLSGNVTRGLDQNVVFPAGSNETEIHFH